jgi:hypothetical protein
LLGAAHRLADALLTQLSRLIYSGIKGGYTCSV